MKLQIPCQSTFVTRKLSCAPTLITMMVVSHGQRFMAATLAPIWISRLGALAVWTLLPSRPQRVPYTSLGASTRLLSSPLRVNIAVLEPVSRQVVYLWHYAAALYSEAETALPICSLPLAMADLPPATEVAAIPEQNTLSTANDLFIYRRRIAEAPPPEPEISSVTYPSATAHQHLLLDDLNDDVLSLIVDYLFDADELNGKYKYLYTNEGPYFRTHRSTLNLSVVNRRLRAVCVRKLFRDVHRCSESMGQLNRQLKDIELDAVLLGSIR